MDMPTFFINNTQVIGQVMASLTTETTGSIFLTYLSIMLFIMLIAMVLRIPMEFTAILILPMLVVMASYIGSFVPVLGLFLIYLAIIFIKNFFFSR